MSNGKATFLNSLKIHENPHLKEYRTEYYRGVGGYKNRWLIRKERIIEEPVVLMFDPRAAGLSFLGDKMFIAGPKAMALIRRIQNG